MANPPKPARAAQARGFQDYLRSLGYSQDSAAMLVGEDATRFRQVASGWRGASFWLIARMERTLTEPDMLSSAVQLARLRSLLLACAEAEMLAARASPRRERLWSSLPRPNDPPRESS